MKHNKASVLILGLGRTGLASLRYFAGRNHYIIAYDAAIDAVHADALRQSYSKLLLCRQLPSSERLSVDCLVLVSPGINLQQPNFAALTGRNYIFCSDIDVFARTAKAPIIAITGSNGKTTVATLVAKCITASGKSVALAGNIGLPVLDLLQQPVPDYYVLELSSFQLEYTQSLANHIAVLLNVTPDHIDRHGSMESYTKAKHRIFERAKLAIVNADESHWHAMALPPKKTFSVEVNTADYYLDAVEGVSYLKSAEQSLQNTTQLLLQGMHHWQNALVVFAVADSIGLKRETVASVLAAFSGIEHRCEKLALKARVHWYNDSKATNEGATIAAIKTLASIKRNNLIVILGGDAKGAAFLDLKYSVSEGVSAAIVFGQDASILEDVLEGVVAIYRVTCLKEAVELANHIAVDEDMVLLSPACSSLDMFTSYQQRGELFKQYVEALI